MDLGHFSLEEVRCKETGTLPPVRLFDSAPFALLVSLLNEIRGDEPLVITSWYRNPDHSIERAKPHPGVHTTGLAVDMALRGERALSACRAFLRPAYADWLGLGVSQKGSWRFIHADFGGHELVQMMLKPAPPRPMIWSY